MFSCLRRRTERGVLLTLFIARDQFVLILNFSRLRCESQARKDRVDVGQSRRASRNCLCKVKKARTRSLALPKHMQSLSIHLNNRGAQKNVWQFPKKKLLLKYLPAFMASGGEYGHEQLVGMEMSQASSAECFHFFGIIMQKYFATFIIRFGRALQKFRGRKLCLVETPRAYEWMNF